MRKLLFLLSLIFIFSFAKAQIPIPAQYSKAKAELAAENYWEAMPLFKEFLDESKYGNLSNYAALHLAEAALGANQAGQAITALQTISSTGWAKSDESNYLLAHAYFQNNQKPEALRAIRKIQKEEIKALAGNVTYEYLRTETPSFMVANLREFKDNPGYGAAMKVVLESQTILSATERAAYYELQGAGGADLNRIKNETLDLVVILPFTNSSNSSVLSISESDFMFELYQGIELAKSELQNQGVKVSLTTFDSKRDLNYLRNLLQDPAIIKADVIIGPIYPEETDLVSVFAENAKIPFIHPLSNLGERFEEKKFSYLFRPSVISLSQGIVMDLKKKNWGKRVAIGYSGSIRDEKLASLLAADLKKEGFLIIKSTTIDPKDVVGFLQNLGIRTGRGNSNSMVDQIILLSDDPAVAMPTFALLESVSASVPTLVMDSWLTFNFANFEMLEFPNFYFIANNTLNFETEGAASFKEKFYSVYKSNPSLNNSLGYELVYLLSANMSPSKGFDLRRNLNQSAFQKGKLTWGFNFQNSNNNQYVPVFSVESGELKPLN